MAFTRRANQRTLAQAKRDRRELERAIRVELKRKNRGKLVALRQRLRDAKAHRARAIRDAKARCRTGRPETVAAARIRIAREKKEARERCDASLRHARGLRSEVERARAELASERAYQKDLRRIERDNRIKAERERRARRGPGIARIRESDDQVEGNIPPELVPLWRRVKGQIRGTDRRSRTEAFLEYAEEHPDEQYQSLEDKTDAVIRELEARMRNPKRSRRTKRKKNTARKLVPHGRRRESASLARAQSTVRRLRSELAEVKKRRRRNPRRPPREWWRDCLTSVTARRYAHDPAAVCGAAWWRKPASERARIVRRLERSRSRKHRRMAVALAKAERNHARRRRRRNPAGDIAARREYVEKHWGERGTGRVRTERAADPRAGTATELGKLVQVVYLTKKGGDGELTEYEHDFEGRLPTLAYNKGGLIIGGGSYSVKKGGITG